MVDLLDDILTLNISCMGILLSVFTLVYSFIMSNKSELIHVADIQKAEGIKPLSSRKEKHLMTTIATLKRINQVCIILFVANCISGASTWILLRFCGPSAQRVGAISVSIITVVELLFALVCLSLLYIQYRKDTRVESA